MSDHKAVINWRRTGTDFLNGKYSREHTWKFDGGVVVPASPSPSVVPPPFSNPAHVDPEEAFVASVSSCHMLTFLYVAGRQGFQIDSYDDEAIGTMTKNEKGVPWVSSITLHPRIVYSGDKRPTAADEERLHHLAHEQCFIANSIKTEVAVNGTARHEGSVSFGDDKGGHEKKPGGGETILHDARLILDLQPIVRAGR